MEYINEIVQTKYSISGVRAQVVETPAFQFSILTCARGLLATKIIYADGSEISYDKHKHFKFEYQEIKSLEGFAEALRQLADQPNKFIIRGQLKPDVDASKWQQRLLRDRSETTATVECRLRRWVPLDFDGWQSHQD